MATRLGRTAAGRIYRRVSGSVGRLCASCCTPAVDTSNCCSLTSPLPTTLNGIVSAPSCTCGWDGKTFTLVRDGNDASNPSIPVACRGVNGGTWNPPFGGYTFTQTWCVESTQQVTHQFGLICNSPACDAGLPSGFVLVEDAVKLSPFLGACYLGVELGGAGLSGVILTSQSCSPFQLVFTGTISDTLGWCSCRGTSFTITLTG